MARSTPCPVVRSTPGTGCTGQTCCGTVCRVRLSTVATKCRMRWRGTSQASPGLPSKAPSSCSTVASLWCKAGSEAVLAGSCSGADATGATEAAGWGALLGAAAALLVFAGAEAAVGTAAVWPIQACVHCCRRPRLA